jgi:hypothetical protein
MNECLLTKRVNDSTPEGMFTALTYNTHTRKTRAVITYLTVQPTHSLTHIHTGTLDHLLLIKT